MQPKLALTFDLICLGLELLILLPLPLKGWDYRAMPMCLADFDDCDIPKADRARADHDKLLSRKPYLSTMGTQGSYSLGSQMTVFIHFIELCFAITGC